MATFLEGVWIVEDKGDWVPTPSTLDATDFTASGDDYWNIIYATVKHGGSYKGDLENLPGWITIDISFEEGNSLVKITGSFQGTTFTLTQAKEDELYEFFRNHSDLGDPAIFLVKDWTGGVYKKFINPSRSKVPYMECRFAGMPKSHIADRILHFDIALRSAWSS